jgi:ATP-dependent DNA helicase RecQ
LTAGSGDGGRISRTALEVFGHDSLLPGQEAAVCSLLEDHDVLLVAPTGSGKSLVYQLAGVLLGGCTVVVSPLLALQRDQVAGLEAIDAGMSAARISSAESNAERAEIWDRARAGRIQFIFLAPEQLADDEVRRSLASLKPRLVAVDEAHCVSTWGRDFRPDYFRLGAMVRELDAPRVVALTATAAPPVRDDIVERLRLADVRLVVTGFERPNLRLGVVRAASPSEQRQHVADAVTDRDGQGIVYCRTRRSTEEYASQLQRLGHHTSVYHAGLGKRRREEAQAAFATGEVDVMVATSAFGMGIDQAAIRFVVHAEVPDSPDTYYQEVGRAGRDGEPAWGTLVYRAEDLALGRFFSSAVPRRCDVEAVIEAIGDIPPHADRRATLLEHPEVGPRKGPRILNLLTEAQDDGVTGGSPDELVQAALARAESHKKLQHSRVEMMRGYADTDRCRWTYLLRYFGENVHSNCGNCDNCRAGASTQPIASAEARYPIQARVRHKAFGNGIVTDTDEGRITVLFDDIGYRILSADVVQDQHLLVRKR